MDLVSQNLLLTSGGKKDSTYVDDVFSTYLYTGTGGAQRIDNGLKLGNANAGNSVDFGGFGESSDYLQMAHTTDLCFGNGDFTIECWAFAEKHDSWNAIFGNWNNGNPADGYALETVSGDLEFYWYNAAGSYTLVQGAAVPVGQWSHLCVCRSGNTLRVFVNGTMYGSGVSMTEGIRDGTTDFTIGGRVAGGGWWDGNITNLRVTKGQALYTANFTPSTEPFTTTSQGATSSNVKLLCCNKDTVTGSTVTPGTITAFGSPTASNFGTGTASDGEGGMVWIKGRSIGTSNIINDTVRGAGNRISSNSANESASSTAFLSSFNSSGFSVGADNDVSYNGQTFASWSFRKQKGFFDVVTYTGTGVTQNIAHNLGSVPGAIFLKRTDAAHNWGVYHRGMNKGVTPERYRQRLNIAGQEDGNNTNGESYWANTAPTSTHFTVSGPVANNNNTNVSGATYVAYIFAGGASSVATARSVVCDGTGDYLSLGSSSDLAMGTGDFTIEGWYKINAKQNFGFFMNGPSGLSSTYGTVVWNYTGSSYGLQFFGSGNSYATGFTPPSGQWFHLALVRNSGTTSLYYNGKVLRAVADNTNYTNTTFQIGGYDSSPYLMNGSVSNFRIVKGTAVYTSSFNPPTEPLTNITNTVLLCCNNSSTTGSTVTPGTITANGDPTASTDSPFDDPEGYKFGKEGDQNLIKCGHVTTDTTNGAILNLPWEPQWFLYKQNNANNNWIILDSMRSWTADGFVEMLYPNTSGTESGGNGYEELGGRTIKFQGYGNNYDFMYIAIRRPDGYVGKPPEAGTDVFTIDTGNGSSIIPSFDSGFPVDMAFYKYRITASADWLACSRLMGTKYVITNSTATEVSFQYFTWDSNVGWANESTAYATYYSWMWKRHAGFDVVCYDGNSTAGRGVPHNLGQVPEMIWVKKRSSSSDGNWSVYHKGLNGGTNPEDYYINLNGNDAEINNLYRWNDTPHNSTHFTLGTSGSVNDSGQTYIAMLFASVDGISKCGYFTGTGSEMTITTGFQPRFLILRKSSATNENWEVLDTTRGWGAGNDQRLNLNTNAAQSSIQFGAPTSTGFTLPSNWTESGYNFIYYAHA